MHANEQHASPCKSKTSAEQKPKQRRILHVLSFFCQVLSVLSNGHFSIQLEFFNFSCKPSELVKVFVVENKPVGKLTNKQI